MKMTEALIRMNLILSMDKNIDAANALLIQLYKATMSTEIGKYFHKYGPAVIDGALTLFDEQGNPLESKILTKEEMILKMMNMNTDKMFILVSVLSYFHPYFDFEITENSTIEEMVGWILIYFYWDQEKQDWYPK